MARLIHLSDLHFGASDKQAPLFDGLVQTLATQKADGLLLTGDVFDTSTAEAHVIEGFLTLYARIDEALGGEVPALILPGNHDRRDAGVFAPWSNGLFAELKRRMANRPHVHVLGQQAPFLAERVALPGLEADVVAYDSTWLPEGKLSAGGLIRQEDLLQVAAELMQGDAERPLLFLLHHHLVPTPVTDTAFIETDNRSPWEKLLVRQVLPRLVSNGDREELTMTALGAGTALSTLHHLGRAALVLHGHKHYPTARLLSGTSEPASDVLMVSAGSCGTATSWGGGDFDEAPRLWPSLNVVTLDAQGVDITTIAWSPWDVGRRTPPRHLVSARREHRRWVVDRPQARPERFEPVLARNASEVRLTHSSGFLGRYDVSVHRTIEATDAAYMPHYWEIVAGAPGAKIRGITVGGEALDDRPAPDRLQLPMRGEARYVIQGGVVATVEEAATHYDGSAAFEWVGLLNRSRTAEARLTVHLGPVKSTPFASLTDLTSGQERPLPLKRDGDVVTVQATHCGSRSLLRVYWPLQVQ